MFNNWRGCKEFVELGLPMSTTSNEACKLYDASLAQFAGGYNDTSMGGMEGSLTRMLAADPEFVMAHVVKNASELMGIGRSIVLDAELKRDIDTMVTLSDRPTVNPREQKHVRALQLWANGDLTAACSTWEEILLDYPLDMLAIKLSQEGYFYLGMHPQMRDSVARCIRLWKPTIPLYSYLFGMHAFGLEETNLYPQAEKAGRKALELNKSDAWATHALCHVMEMEGRQDEGIQFLSSTLNDWENCGIAGHNFWHWALYHIEKNDYQGALDIFDGNVKKRLQGPPSMLALIDGASLLYRLEMEGVDVKERWNDVVEVCRPHVDDHITTFNDLHILMGCLGAKSKETTDKMMASLKEFVRDGCGTNHGLTRDIGLPMCEAFVAYDSGDYGTAVDLMYGLRYQIVKIGGSHAQRDIFNLFLINAALKSPEKEHRKLARHLLAERKALKENAPMTDRLIARALASHVE